MTFVLVLFIKLSRTSNWLKSRLKCRKYMKKSMKTNNRIRFFSINFEFSFFFLFENEFISLKSA